MKVGVLVILSLAVAAEIVGTSGLKASEGFTRLWPVAVGGRKASPPEICSGGERLSYLLIG